MIDIAGTGELGELFRNIVGTMSPGAQALDFILPGAGTEIIKGVAEGVVNFFTGGAASTQINRSISPMEQGLEKFKLGLSIDEAKKPAMVAEKQYEVAMDGFAISGMLRYAALLRHEHAVQNLTAGRRKTAPTKWLSGQSTFPDSLYEFTQSGRMEWEVPESLLSLNTPTGTLRNLAVVLVPPARRFHFGALMANHEVEFNYIGLDPTRK